MYGPIAPTKIPKQDFETVMFLAGRYQRAAQGMEEWAKTAKECVDFMEGRQWTEEQLLKLAHEGRPAMVINKIAPLVRLVLGYHRNNRTDIKSLPGDDGLSSEDIAEVITRTFKQISESGGKEFIDTEVFLDGILTGRGWYDSRLDFSENDLGEVKITATDPFTVLPDPDADDYDINNGADIRTSRWVSAEEIEQTYGASVADLVRPYINGETWQSSPLTDYALGGEETTPQRGFGMQDDTENDNNMLRFQETFATDFVDTWRKNIRLVDTQYWRNEVRDVFIDLETGERATIPRDQELRAQGHDPIQFKRKAIYHAERLGNPLEIRRRVVPQVRWTVVVGDVIVYDDWSPYKRFTLNGYFPYFRRGQTMGMVQDLIDPQRDINKKRASKLEIAGRLGNPKWFYGEDTFTPDEESRFLEDSSSAGSAHKVSAKSDFGVPKRDDGTQQARLFEKLEQDGADDLRTISGINESAMGETDNAKSGRAIEARQRQAVISLQVYLDNYQRTQRMIGDQWLELVQGHYTEERIFRILGEDGKLVQTIINKQEVDPVTGQYSRLNDITLGKYRISIDTTPLSASFANAQFEEALAILEKLGPAGQALMSVRPDLLVDMSSLPRKEEWTMALQEAMGLVTPPGAGGVIDPNTGTPVDPGVSLGQGASIDQAALPAGNIEQVPASGAPPGA